MADNAQNPPAFSTPAKRPLRPPTTTTAPPPSPIDTFPIRTHHAIHRHRADSLAETATRFQKRAATLDHAAKILTRIRELKILDGAALATSGPRENLGTEFSVLRDKLARLARDAPARPPRRHRILGEDLARPQGGPVAGAAAGLPPITLPCEQLPSVSHERPTRPRGVASDASSPPFLVATLAPDFAQLDVSAVDRALDEIAGLRAEESADHAEVETAAQLFVTEAERVYPAGQAIKEPDTARALTDGLRASILTESTLAMLAQANQASLPALRILS